MNPSINFKIMPEKGRSGNLITRPLCGNREKPATSHLGLEHHQAPKEQYGSTVFINHLKYGYIGPSHLAKVSSSVMVDNRKC